MNNLKKIREGKGLTIEDLAYLSGLSRFTIFKIENGSYPSGQTIGRLTHALRGKAVDIFPWIDGSQNEPTGVEAL